MSQGTAVRICYTLVTLGNLLRRFCHKGPASISAGISGLDSKFSWLGLGGGLGFEPRPAESESAVLPLDDPPIPAIADKLPVWRGGRKSSAGGRALATHFGPCPRSRPAVAPRPWRTPASFVGC